MRLHGWPELLDECVQVSSAREFEYGAFDCMLFAADCVHAIAGIDHGERWRGYDSREDAYRIIAEFGSIEAMLTSILGPPVHPAFAQRGDVVLASMPVPEGESGEAVGVCLGVYCAFAGPKGITRHRTSVARLAWKID